MLQTYLLGIFSVTLNCSGTLELLLWTGFLNNFGTTLSSFETLKIFEWAWMTPAEQFGSLNSFCDAFGLFWKIFVILLLILELFRTVLKASWKFRIVGYRRAALELDRTEILLAPGEQCDSLNRFRVHLNSFERFWNYFEQVLRFSQQL